MSDTAARPRGRPRLFDEEAALDALTELFWRKGYAQTSVADLVEASGVHKSSLYSTFGTKDELFATVLRRYLDNRMTMFGHMIEAAGTGVEGLHGFLEMVQSDLISGPGQEGCLLVNSSTELHGTAPGFEDFTTAYREAMRAQLRLLVAQVEPADDPDQQRAEQRTDLLLTYLFGLIVTARGGGSADDIGRAVEAMHLTVDGWVP